MKIDPKARYCKCGKKWYFNKFDYIRMILFGQITMRCPNCQRLHKYRLIYHAVEDFNSTRNENNELEKNLKEIWENG